MVIINHNDAEEAPSMRLAVETLEELDWCLDQLESLQVQSFKMVKMTKTRTTKNMYVDTKLKRMATTCYFFPLFYPFNQTVSDPSECVRHGSQQVQENVEQGIIRVQVAISNVFLKDRLFSHHIYICVCQTITKDS